MTRTALLLAFACLLFASCGEGGPGTPAGRASPTQNETPSVRVTPGPRPAAVPESAEPVDQTRQLGRIVREAGRPPEVIEGRELVAASCEAGVITFTTSRETVYAERGCDGFWGPDAAPLFVGHQSALTLEVTAERFRVLIQTEAGSQAEFTVAGIWVD